MDDSLVPFIPMGGWGWGGAGGGGEGEGEDGEKGGDHKFNPSDKLRPENGTEEMEENLLKSRGKKLEK